MKGRDMWDDQELHSYLVETKADMALGPSLDKQQLIEMAQNLNIGTKYNISTVIRFCDLEIDEQEHFFQTSATEAESLVAPLTRVIYDEICK